MKTNPEVESKVAETAYCWLRYNNYGSEAKAIKAMRRRKAMGHLPAETAKVLLDKAVEILLRTEALREETAARFGKPSFFHLTEEQFQSGVEKARVSLLKEFPDHEATIHYMLGMLWEMAYRR